MKTHIARDGQSVAACGQAGRTIPWDEAMSDPDGPAFDCVDCHQSLTGGKRHSHPEGDDE